MIDKFKAFLAGSPHKMDESWQETWAYHVAVPLPHILRDWYDPDFSDVWENDCRYYAEAHKKLSRLKAFKTHCSESSTVLRALELITEFLSEEGCMPTKRKAPEPKTCDLLLD